MSIRKKKIVVTGTRGVPNIMGGVETHCEELFPRVAQLGYNVMIVRRSAYVKVGVDEACGVVNNQWKGIKLVDVTTPRRKAVEAFVHTIKAVILARWLGAGVVHIHAIGPALAVPFARMLKLKVVFTHHGPDYDRDKWGWFAKRILHLGERWGCKFANEVIVISDVIRESVVKKYGREEHVHLIYNGVPQPDICHEPEYFEKLGIEEGKYILGMCRFVPEKRLHDLLEAYLKVKGSWSKGHEGEEFPYKLVLAGDADFEDRYSHDLKKAARENGVVLTGFVRGSKLHSLLTNALCYSLPSSHEGLPIALLEAMSYQLPVVVSDIPANMEVGLSEESYFHLGDTNELASKLQAICEKPLKRIDYDMTKYNWNHIANQVAEVYEKV